MTNNALITEENFPTHKLTVKLEDNTYRVFYLNKNQAKWMHQNINGVEQFICLPVDIDPDSPTFYPKRGAWMEKIKQHELDRMRQAYEVEGEKSIDEEEKKEREVKARAVRNWIEENPKEWEKLLDRATKELTSSAGIFNSASKTTRKHLIKFHAMALVADEVL